MSNIELDLIVNGDYSVVEKLNLITEYKEKILKEITDAIMKVKSGYTYCEKCKQWYKNKAWENETITEQRQYCKFMPYAEWEQPEYDTAESKVEYSVCPVGHKCEITSYPAIVK